MTLLWGVNDPGPWLAKPLLEEIALGTDIAAMMMLSNAQHQQRIASMKAAGIKKVKILGSHLEVCAECGRQEGKVYDISKVPDIPFDDCTCENGCSCTVVAKM